MRKLLRFDINQPVTVTVLNATRPRLEGSMVNISHGGFKLVLAQSIQPGTAVEVDLPDAMILAAVRYCHADPTTPEEFHIGLEHIQVLSNMGELAKLVNGVMGSSSHDREPVKSS